MRLLVDAQLPARLACRLLGLGHDAVHTSSLPDGNRTTDREIAAAADRDGRIVVTKDADFRNSHLLTGSPVRLLVVATGNIRNDDLLDLFESRLAEIEEARTRAGTHARGAAAPRPRAALEPAGGHLRRAVAVYDISAARETAEILVAAEASGRPMSLADAQIAGICLAGDYELATRNVSDFSDTAGLTIINPFE